MEPREFIWLEDEDVEENIKNLDYMIASSLKAMHRALLSKLPVSKGFFIPPCCIKELVRDIISNLDKNNENFIDVVREKLKRIEMPSWFSSEVKENYSKFGIFDYEDAKSLDDAVVNMITAPRGDIKVVVRALFPKIGYSLLDPFYNIHGDKGIEEKVVSLISQSFYDTYQTILQKLNIGNTEFGILVQEWCSCEKSVVMSNFDPLSGKKMFVLEACPGTPLAIYRGLVSPELHVVEKDGNKVKFAGNGNIAFYNSNDGQEGINPKPMEFGETILSEKDLEKIIEIGEKLDSILESNYIAEIVLSGSRIKVTNIFAGFRKTNGESLSVKTHPHILTLPQLKNSDYFRIHGIVKTISEASIEEENKINYDNDYQNFFSILLSETGSIDVLGTSINSLGAIAFRNSGRFSSAPLTCSYLNIPSFSLHYGSELFKSKFVPGQKITISLKNEENGEKLDKYHEGEFEFGQKWEIPKPVHLPIDMNEKSEENDRDSLFSVSNSAEDKKSENLEKILFPNFFDIGVCLDDENAKSITHFKHDLLFTNASFLRSYSNYIENKKIVFVFAKDIYDAEDVKNIEMNKCNIVMVVPFPSDLKNSFLKGKWIMLNDVLQMFALEHLHQKGVEGVIINIKEMVKNIRNQAQQVCFEKALSHSLKNIPEKMKIGIIVPHPVKERGLEKLISVFPDYVFVDPQDYENVVEKMDEIVKRVIKMVFRCEYARK